MTRMHVSFMLASYYKMTSLNRLILYLHWANLAAIVFLPLNKMVTTQTF